MPTERDSNLDSHRAVLVASLVARLKIDFVRIITNEFFFHVHKVVSALPFPCLIMGLLRQVNVPLIRVIDNEV